MQTLPSQNRTNFCEERLPLINISSLFDTSDNSRATVAEKIGAACRKYGFFYVEGHGISVELINNIHQVSNRFFDVSLEEKMKLHVSKFGGAGKGYFRILGELLPGNPVLREGLYFGQELPEDHPKVTDDFPLLGPNPFPEDPNEMKDIALQYMEEATKVAQALLEGIALSLGLDAQYFRRTYTDEPSMTLGLLHYPSCPASCALEGDSNEQWAIGVHSDYGLITLLLQDDVGGLEVKSGNKWLDGTPIPGTLVCNIGDMLDRLTGGIYRSTDHRVKVNRSGRDRYSFPFFFDPGFDKVVVPLPESCNLNKPNIDEDRRTRWDGLSVHEIKGTYGEYYLAKIQQALPQIKQNASLY